MMYIAPIIHFMTVTFTLAAAAIGVGIGQGLTTQAALDAIDLQPSAKDDIAKTAILSMALIETAAVLAAVISGLVLLKTYQNMSHPFACIAELGIVAAVGLPGFVLGIFSAYPAREACYSIARQPFFAQKIIRFMLLTVSLMQTPTIFGVIIALFIYYQSGSISSLAEAISLVAAGVSLGVGSIGPAIGLASFATTACNSIGKNREAYNSLLSFSLISQAIIETPIIFSLVIAITILLASPPTHDAFLYTLCQMAAALCIGIGTVGPGIGSGIVSRAACEEITAHLDIAPSISKVSLLCQGIVETNAMYAFIIAIILLLV